MIHSVTVYCSSSSAISRCYFDAAAELGRVIAHSRWSLVYGGNAIGLMGHLANAVRAAGGKVIGITPQLLVDKGIHDTRCDELVITVGMRERKALLEQRGDAYIALPGGLGTLEEIFEIIVGKLLHYHNKPIVLLNTDEYYQPLLAMIEHGIENHFIKAKARDLYFVAPTVTAAAHYLRTYAPPGDEGFEPPTGSSME